LLIDLTRQTGKYRSETCRMTILARARSSGVPAINAMYELGLSIAVALPDEVSFCTAQVIDFPRHEILP
jgi:hypothetical protein